MEKSWKNLLDEEQKIIVTKQMAIVKIKKQVCQNMCHKKKR